MEKAEKERKKKKLSLRFVFTQRTVKNSKRIAKKLKKLKRLKNTFMASFQAKIGRKIMRQRENKNYRSVTSLRDA